MAPGLETVLVEELIDLALLPDAGAAQTERGGVTLKLDHAGIMRANLCLRTANRILLRLGTFPAASPEMLYDRARKLDWLVHLGFASGYRLRVSARHSKLQAGDQVSNTVASAVARHMRDHELYPKPADEAPLEFHVRLLDDRCTISLDTSGEHLHRRGTRTHIHTAPLRETVAAAMALIALRSGERPDVIVDTFCGSGTLLIETTDALTGAPPGRHRRFAFEHAAWHRPGRWRQVQRDAAPGPAEGAPLPGEKRRAVDLSAQATELPRMVGIDSDPAALAAARLNLAGGDYAHVELIEADSTTFDFATLNAQRGLIIGNAPFGVRLGDQRSAAVLLTSFLDRLATAGGAWRVCLLVGDPRPVVDHPALRDAAQQPVKIGGLDSVIVTGTVG